MKTIDEIYRELLETFSSQSGYLPSASCDLSARLYAVAAQVQALYLQAEWVMGQAFPQTAQGTYLDYHAETRGIQRSVATAAEGYLRFQVDTAVAQDLSIPAETVCMTVEGRRFQTVEAAVLEAGELYVDVLSKALEPGSGGNVAAGTVIRMAVAPAGVKSCTNPAAFVGGADQEGDEALRIRVLDSFKRLPNGANAAFYEREAMNFPGVAAAKAVGRARGIGTVDVYVATEAGLPGTELLEAIEADLQAKREIAVDVEVCAPQEQTVDVTVAIQAAEGYTYDQAEDEADAAIRAHFTGDLLGKGVTLAELGHLLYSLESVSNYHFTAPAADVAAVVTALPRLGSLTISDMTEEET
ncbi:MAG TPA: baseplate J/gp47 family protein [Candidatus Flavonifractor intestinipullorum]|uniref:Baseplate J/gp47 family protein n=1 Tax=Candidatus Flavonifractor intestinipullorum TaxID=2838587 RepID=A0A9D2MAD4_9FIRM|nr:baseplate J/gp47 family protein [Candidatus Flavonifractor intestinipullorum]